MTKPLFRGICASTVTPFNANGDLALQLLDPHIEWILAEGPMPSRPWAVRANSLL